MTAHPVANNLHARSSMVLRHGGRARRRRFGAQPSSDNKPSRSELNSTPDGNYHMRSFHQASMQVDRADQEHASQEKDAVRLSPHGITMDILQGSVRAKAATGDDSNATAGFRRSPSLTGLARAAAESMHDEQCDDTCSRECRASTSVALNQQSGFLSEGPNKRAKSGATYWVDSASASTNTPHWTAGNPSVTESDPPTSLVSTSDMGQDCDSGCSAARSNFTSEIHGVVRHQRQPEHEWPSVDNGIPRTNDAWLGILTPLLSSIPPDTHPEDYLHDILRQRGYCTEMVPTKDWAQFREPSPEQVSAYDKIITCAVGEDDVSALESLHRSGRRMDACNRFGDSVLHLACRRGRIGALRYLLRASGPSGLAMSDDCGRTPMHDACWSASPRFDVASMVLDTDTRFLRMLDKRGSSPLQYVPQEQWLLWCAFFEFSKEKYWPQLSAGQQDVAGIIERRDHDGVKHGATR